jgi:hypothetical protein
MRDGFLAPGTTYSTAAFAVRFTLAVPAATPPNRWLSTSTGHERQLHVGDPAQEGIGMSFYLPTGGYDDTSTPAVMPPDFVAWMRSDPQLEVLSSKPAQVGGQPATRLEVEADASKISTAPGLCPVNSACVLVASTTPDLPVRPMLIFPGEVQVVYVVNLASGQLLIDLDGGSTEAPCEALLQTLRFVAP